MTTDVNARIDELEQRLFSIHAELRELRRLVAPSPAPAPRPAPAPAPSPPVEWTPLPRPVEWSLPPLGERLRAALPDLTGARSLAWAGGVVTLLGIVFFFVLAVDRGWIGHGTRVGLGAAASALVYAGGIFLRRRYGETISSLAAVGAGIAGGYVTLLAATALYELVPQPVALVLAAGIAGVGVATAWRWSSEIVAGLGLVGALLAPAAIAIEDGFSATGTAFVAVVAAGAIAVAIVRRWRAILLLALVSGAPQLVGLALTTDSTRWASTLVAAVLCAEYLAGALVWHARGAVPSVDRYAPMLLLGSAMLAGGCSFALFDDDTAQGIALLAAAAVYGVVGSLLFPRALFRDPATIVLAAGLALGAIGVAQVLSGGTLAIVWAAEAVALAVCARRLGEARFLVASGAYFALAFVHVLLIDAQPNDLFVRDDASAAGAPSVVATAVAAAALAWAAGKLHEVRVASAALAVPLTLYAASLWIVQLSFDWGHVGVSALWAAAAGAALVAGRIRRAKVLCDGGLIGLALVLLETGAYDVLALDSDPRSAALLAVGAIVLASGYAYELRGRRLSWVGVAAVASSVAFSMAGSLSLLGGPRADGGGLLAVAAVHGVLGLGAFTRPQSRDLASLHWAAALAVAVVGTGDLLSDTPLVAVWAAGAALLAIAARREVRLLVASAAYLALAAGHALVFDAPPTDFFVANDDPAAGAIAVTLAAVAAGVLASQTTRYRSLCLWIGGALATYALSLGILQVSEWIGAASVTTSFQRGHTAVSAAWAVLGLALLYLGLTRRRSLRIGGFALFAGSLAKIFLYDLPSLSSVARALSFLAVGVLLLVGGFFYQRLSVSAARGTGRPSLG